MQIRCKFNAQFGWDTTFFPSINSKKRGTILFTNSEVKPCKYTVVFTPFTHKKNFKSFYGVKIVYNEALIPLFLLQWGYNPATVLILRDLPKKV